MFRGSEVKGTSYPSGNANGKRAKLPAGHLQKCQLGETIDGSKKRSGQVEEPRRPKENLKRRHRHQGLQLAGNRHRVTELIRANQ
jgi:hypothetical protein